MSARLIPAGVVTVVLDDMMLDLVCFEYALAHVGSRHVAGKLPGYLEATFAANPGLADAGAVLPRGIVINMPEHRVTIENKVVRLWD